MKSNIKIGNENFASRNKAEERARQISKNNPIGSRLLEKDYAFMTEYFQLFHHDWINKNGVGIDYFYITKVMPYGNIGFKLVRIDGTEDDISYTISKISKSNPKNDFVRALRYAIRPQIEEFRSSAFKSNNTLECPFRKIAVTEYDCHVDHFQPTFMEIVSNYILERNIENFDGLVKPSSESLAGYLLTDENQKEDFYRYHKKHANLRVLSKLANLSDAKK